MKLWQKSTTQLDEVVEQFTIGRDRELDLRLARYDVAASIAHAHMLGKTGIISAEEASQLIGALEAIAGDIERGTFRIEDGVEDIHSQLELELVRRLGPIGEKIHTARSRNDQVLTALMLYVRDRLRESARTIGMLIERMLSWAIARRDALVPGLTHLQAAMPSSLGLWMSSYAESLVEDMTLTVAALELASKNPLGTAAGYGSSFPIDRTITTELLGFRTMVSSPPAAQLLRGKLEHRCALAVAAYASTLARWATDVVLFVSPGFRFLRLPSELTTGSSIMPHKQNPDVFELLRGRFHSLAVLPVQLSAIVDSLPSGYHRDYQLLKELLLPAWDDFDRCIAVVQHVVPSLEPVEDVLTRPEFREIWSVEAIYHRMQQRGESFRTAYRAIGETLQNADNTLSELPQNTQSVIARFDADAIHAAKEDMLTRILT
ncbi:MAG: argininosuccinate lyase [Candidatus Kapaibacterium sp.]|nr:MAG: argininosuccinate lyase [Candidatus Kapabacteria bacterium]